MTDKTIPQDEPRPTSTAIAKPDQPLPAGGAIAPAVGSVQMGMAPRNIEEGWRLANIFAKSDLVPKDFRDKPANVFLALQYGIEIGLPPMQALQSIAVVNGRPSIWGDGFLALIVASDKYADHDEYFLVDGERRELLTFGDLEKDTTAAVCKFVRKGKATAVVQSFSVGMARAAGLMGAKPGAGGKEGPWRNYPDRMLKYRARSWAGRDAFPDVLRGIITTEEARDIATPEPAALTPIASPRRMSRTANAGRSTHDVIGPADPISASPGVERAGAGRAGSEPSSGVLPARYVGEEMPNMPTGESPETHVENWQKAAEVIDRAAGAILGESPETPAEVVDVDSRRLAGAPVCGCGHRAEAHVHHRDAEPGELAECLHCTCRQYVPETPIPQEGEVIDPSPLLGGRHAGARSMVRGTRLKSIYSPPDSDAEVTDTEGRTFVVTDDHLLLACRVSWERHDVLELSGVKHEGKLYLEELRILEKGGGK